MTEEKKLFLLHLRLLAEVCNYKPSPEIIELYVVHLEPLGFLKVAQALEQIIVNRSTRDPFPSIKDIKKILQPELSNKALADDISNRIIAAFRKHGYTWPQGSMINGGKFFEARVNGEFYYFETFKEALLKECGEAAWHVLDRMGGYSAVCAEWGQSESAESILRAQFRDLAMSVLEQAKAGIVNVPPALPAPQGNEKIMSLVQKITKQLPGVKNETNKKTE